MTAAAQKQIAAKALSLPRRARATLAAKLLKSLDDQSENISRKDWNESWKTELNRRIEEVKSGKVKLVSHAEVRRKIDRILGRA